MDNPFIIRFPNDSNSDLNPVCVNIGIIYLQVWEISVWGIIKFRLYFLHFYAVLLLELKDDVEVGLILMQASLLLPIFMLFSLSRIVIYMKVIMFCIFSSFKSCYCIVPNYWCVNSFIYLSNDSIEVAKSSMKWHRS